MQKFSHFKYVFAFILNASSKTSWKKTIFSFWRTEHKVQLLTKVALVIKQGMKPSLLTHVRLCGKSHALSTRTGFRTTIVSFKVTFIKRVDNVLYQAFGPVNPFSRGADHLEERGGAVNKNCRHKRYTVLWEFQERKDHLSGKASGHAKLHGRGVCWTLVRQGKLHTANVEKIQSGGNGRPNHGQAETQSSSQEQMSQACWPKGDPQVTRRHRTAGPDHRDAGYARLQRISCIEKQRMWD